MIMVCRCGCRFAAIGHPPTQMRKKDKRVLLVNDDGSYLMRSLPRIFSKAGAFVTLAVPSGAACRHWPDVDASIDFDPNAADAPGWLDQIIDQVAPDALIVIHERLVERTLALPEQEAPRWRSRLGLSHHFMSRSSSYQWALDHQLPVPDGAVCESLDEVLEALAQHGDLFLKRNASSAGVGVARVTTPDAARDFWNQLPHPQPVTAQRSLAGATGTTEMVAMNGRLMAWHSSEKWLTSKEHGPSVARHIRIPAGMAELAESIARLSGMNGFLGFDWIDHADGVRMIELHPRPSSGFTIGHLAGVDYSLAARQLLEGIRGESQAPIPGLFVSKPNCCYFPDHLHAVFTHHRWRELKYYLPGANTHSWSMVPWHSPRLIGQMLAKSWKLIPKPISRQPRTPPHPTGPVVIPGTH